VPRVFYYMESDNPGAAGALRPPGATRPRGDVGDAATAVEVLYQATALSLIRLAYLMLGDRPSAEDVVQEAFFGLYRRWDRLAEAGNATYYLRASVLNGCRSVLRHRAVRRRGVAYQLPEASAEAVALSGAEREEVARAVARLPRRQREALVLRFYLELPDEEIARVMSIRPGTVRSTIHRALGALGVTLREMS
jgi:RNA polymerase sigma-70 factor (sigma-E family)